MQEGLIISAQIVIIGAGIAGLTLAGRLAGQGIKTVIIEREKAVGGLARSFVYPNGSTFDIGPHRFHTDDKNVQDFIENTLADNLITIDRNSQLFLFGKYVPWPINLKSVLTLPPGLLMRAACDLFIPARAQNDSFQDYIIEKYGKTLFNVFFKPYSEKFLNYTCENVHKDWASAGINRATIDKQIKTDSLASLIKSVLFDKNPDTKFLYPKTGGIGAFSEKLAENISQDGGEIILSTEVAQILDGNNTIKSIITDKGEKIQADYVFWSGSIDDLQEIGNASSNMYKMRYLSTILFNYIISDYSGHDFQWCYYGDSDMEVNRICLPRNFNPKNTPKGKESICVEVALSNENSDIWKDPSRLDWVIETFLLRAGLIKSLDNIDDLYIEKIKQTYPIYSLNYPRKLKSVFHWAENKWDNLALIGRTGRFWYNNMDHSIAASLETARRFIKDYKKGRLQKGERYSIEDRHYGE